MEKHSQKPDLKQIKPVGTKADSEADQLLEAHSEQAYFWRAIALLHMPTTVFAVVAAFLMYYYSYTVVHVPLKAPPGHYPVDELEDSDFIDAAVDLVKLLGSFQAPIARRQFLEARRYLWEPALSIFEVDMLKTELRTVEETHRSQWFFVNKGMIRVMRFPGDPKVVVRVPGVRQKVIGDEPQSPDGLVYYLKMITIPRNVHNGKGIVVNGIRTRSVDAETLRAEDLLAEQSA